MTQDSLHKEQGVNEQIVFDDGGVVVTPSRIRVGSNSYSMEGVIEVRMEVVKTKRDVMFALKTIGWAILAGVIVGLFEVKGGIAVVEFGVILVVWGLFWDKRPSRRPDRVQIILVYPGRKVLCYDGESLRRIPAFPRPWYLWYQSEEEYRRYWVSATDRRNEQIANASKIADAIGSVIGPRNKQ